MDGLVFRLNRTLVFLAAGAMLAACAGASNASNLPLAPSGGAFAAKPDAKTGDLLYAADLTTNDVYVYSYPGGVLKRTLTGFKAVHYECVDSAGDVFIDDTAASKVLEYARGGDKPIHTFRTPGSTPNSCAIDPVTGNLAISHDPLGSGAGGVDVYVHATGNPKTYSTPNVFRYYFVGYDAAGNLFVDGTDMHVTFELAELSAGSNTAQAITLNQSVSLPGAIQWDGQYLAIGDQVCIECASQIDRVSVSGSNGTVVATVSLSDSCDVLQYWIYNKRVVTANDCGNAVKYFSYPEGGSSLKTLGAPLSQPVGVAVDPKVAP
jgi:hypothetical protein